MFRLTATDVTITIQESNDNENWRSIAGSTETLAAEDYGLGTKRTAIGSTYVRLKYAITGSATQVGILAAGIHLSTQD